MTNLLAMAPAAANEASPQRDEVTMIKECQDWLGALRVLREHRRTMIEPREAEFERLATERNITPRQWDAFNRLREEVGLAQAIEEVNPAWNDLGDTEAEIMVWKPETLFGLLAKTRVVEAIRDLDLLRGQPREDLKWEDEIMLTLVDDIERLAFGAAKTTVLGDIGMAQCHGGEGA